MIRAGYNKLFNSMVKIPDESVCCLIVGLIDRICSVISDRFTHMEREIASKIKM